MHPKTISIADYTYNLPNERIAAYPLEKRDESKLLVYKDNVIKEDVYKNIAAHLPEKSLLVFNNTKVIPARIVFQKSTGGIIEIFCLEPYEENKEYNAVMQKTKSIQWKCMIGGASKWKEGSLEKKLKIENEEVIINVRLVEKLSDAYVTEFSWQPVHFSFVEIIQQIGETPLPPYIKRKPEEGDKERYQTIYALYQGSVAAPTAGLHFTKEIFSSLVQKNIATDYATLHVGAGTFKPVKAALMEGHEMHSEWIDVTMHTIKNMIANVNHTVVAVGTTSLRTIESLYWLGVKTILYPEIIPADLTIYQWDVYESPLSESTYQVEEALSSLLQWMEKNSKEHLITSTQILIAPGYQFRIAKAIITNFHQPNSTLLLLVAAAVGNYWKNIYNYALQNDFRFLSYGDGSLLFIG
ncbi:S-adenosylmethionine:tRNA ribosyltransferase-isomerase [Ferruginibacter albus]|uniref:S-adenosylmethionine:tRNA ribosyltransferase-isomerase n=1 Tax=Ferruginibacter albus TaxID=2875540 RepID=UPI001CC77007|nr:S-adenosylmethionine:tRNA ribosyltransferase-isomerase [Ferruginibacter albus]UAY51904.1 S-adenosylmethionine:tRNA ribosyltransferase-isomerase [Ferruginibacter albus]